VICHALVGDGGGGESNSEDRDTVRGPGRKPETQTLYWVSMQAGPLALPGTLCTGGYQYSRGGGGGGADHDPKWDLVCVCVCERVCV
jgi:hypothetical protein